ncbi:MAG: FAD-dependent oxidoreductase [Chitinophagales bacterium]|nr:NAD(P)/FAD-dependent oxidoreductase [Chitinophagales bacterium]MCO5280042.1 FAD-dependent oxidoreductase [Chitinophagales bacterium]OJV28347.1 MAG: hypothetical protein BGO32_05815 [Bacteroidetes bacterium 37-13]HRN93383.1 FAD-dependent oxidoreductase [Chitinophagales bacterium]HRP38663.1 FAD-dependent oxidoreductase [Chitinophagales bacterium]
MKEHFDVAIIGSGLGGLLCGAILSKEGKRVCIVEKNEQIGGSLQTFKHEGVTFDTGVHYIGGLAPKQNLYSIFNYVGIIDRLKLHFMAEDGFDVTLFHNDQNEYRFGMGYENFSRILCNDFPEEEKAITQYCIDIQEICRNFPLYNLKAATTYSNLSIFEKSAKQYFDELTTNKKLQNVLAGNNMLYIGIEEKTPLYVHALVVNSYIESAAKCKNGGDQIAKLLARMIKENGGKVLRKKRVTNIQTNEGKVEFLQLEDGSKIFADTFISNIHPAQTLELIQDSAIKSPYRNRIKSLENSIGTFVIYAKLKPKKIAYTNRNYYCFTTNDVWNTTKHNEENWPLTYALFSDEDESHHSFCKSAVIMTYMRYNELSAWHETYNTTLQENNRSEDYLEFKKQKAEKLLKVVAKKFPEIAENIESYCTSTPLTFRDYIGTNDGSAYGIIKDFNEPLKTRILPSTKISNLFLTGQNVNLHGILGVSITALFTCGNILGMEYLLNKIHQANETCH